MSKHLYLHYNSNHTKSLLNSIPYSQGLRIIKICSNENDRKNKLLDLMSQFKIRNYPRNILSEVSNKLSSLNREQLLIPNGHNIINYLQRFNPEIVNRYDIRIPNVKTNENRVFIVFPFYNNIPTLKSTIINKIRILIEDCNVENVKACAQSFEIVLSFKKTNSIGTLLNNK